MHFTWAENGSRSVIIEARGYDVQYKGRGDLTNSEPYKHINKPDVL